MATKKATNSNRNAASVKGGARDRTSSATRAGAHSKATARAKRSPARGGTDSAAHSNTTIDHDEIREWAEARGAHPACVKGTGDQGDVGILRLDFPGYSEEKLQTITWDEFFEKFDERELALVYQEKTAGGATSNFNKLVSREETAQAPKTRSAR